MQLQMMQEKVNQFQQKLDVESQAAANERFAVVPDPF